MVGVYIPPQANATATAAICALADQITTVDNSNPDSLVLILGDFYHTFRSTSEVQTAGNVCHERVENIRPLLQHHQRGIPRGSTRLPWFLRPCHDIPLFLISPETETSETLRSKYQALGRRVHPASQRMSSMYGLGQF